MGSLVFAGAMSHAPGIAAFTQAANTKQRESFFGATAELKNAIAKASPDVLVVVAPDHFSNFFVDNMPAACVTLNDSYIGPVEDWLGISKVSIKGAPDLARSILRHAFEAGVEPSFSEDAALEHGVIVPLNLVTPGFDVPIVWIMQNCQVPPLLSLSRCYAFGQAIRKAIDASPLRVGILGTGGLSHAPGAAEADCLDETFDRYFLDCLNRNAIDDIVSIPNSRLDDAGFGTWEIRQWITALGAAHDRKPRTLAYEAVVEWDTGCAVAVYE
jgi:aromatic ring-opening dioxygenase catalytic subunit (LigB family)